MYSYYENRFYFHSDDNNDDDDDDDEEENIIEKWSHFSIIFSVLFFKNIAS